MYFVPISRITYGPDTPGGAVFRPSAGHAARMMPFRERLDGNGSNKSPKASDAGSLEPPFGVEFRTESAF